MQTGRAFCFLLATLTLASPACALEPGQAAGALTIDGAPIALAFAASASVEDLFDSSKQDTLIVLSDHALGITSPDDEIELSLRARRGELSALTLRLDGNKLINVKVNHKTIDGIVLLPGAWFQFTPAPKGAARLKLAPRENDGHAYACDLEFYAPPARAHALETPTTEPSAAPETPAPTLPPANTSSLSKSGATALLIQAIMQKDQHQAVQLVKLGADPNGRDRWGIPVLNWAVMTCLPEVVQALVNAKADLHYERAPGMTIMTEAGACPAAAEILRAAGAK